MTLMLSEANYRELCQSSQALGVSLHSPVSQRETRHEVPSLLGRGSTRCCELSPGVWLDLIDKEFTQPWALSVAEHGHLVQITVLLSGAIDFDGVYPTLDAGQSYVSGSGRSRGYVARYGRSPQLKGINIHLDPKVMQPFLAEHGTHLRPTLLKTDEWKSAWFPDVTPAMRTVAQQMLQCPFHGVTRRFFLQAKVFELLALQLDGMMADQGAPPLPTTLKPVTVERIYEARARLVARLENPPSISELAQQVGVSDRTLRRGFRELFSISVIGYLTQQRLNQAEHLLRQGNYTVAEVANSVGFTHLGHFAAAFRKQFGVSPREWVGGRAGASHPTA
ncbi:helix-turn-helix transcriptional regulator [Nodosilinea sp. LEGE 07088]|uniref:helix-turn-helix transcriptional regulator n=1 Tax=Nodosilinea sp. LEGE 07088 TaxID=2777968 RepID=UPI0018804724|nr:AraC family transcriptional regulator [Nodosilinea sp. LEGE 07088]MBE9136178.1 helix-turn-helix transcriptional regulator [Nodosilinea sp. LEGE 07088]